MNLLKKSKTNKKNSISQKAKRTDGYLRFLRKQVARASFRKRWHKWIFIDSVLELIDILLLKSDKHTSEILLRLSVNIKDFGNKMDTNLVPLKAIKILIKRARQMNNSVK